MYILMYKTSHKVIRDYVQIKYKSSHKVIKDYVQFDVQLLPQGY